LISGVRSIFGKQKLVLVFQPHLFSRTKDLVDEFAASLDLADEVILLPIYPARELPVEGVTSDWLMSKMTIKEKKVLSKEAMVSLLEKERPALIVMAGAGDIDAQVKNVKAILEKK
jgi:UDP-N-acetylmuramate--alanine ligase